MLDVPTPIRPESGARPVFAPRGKNFTSAARNASMNSAFGSTATAREDSLILSTLAASRSRGFGAGGGVTLWRSIPGAEATLRLRPAALAASIDPWVSPGGVAATSATELELIMTLSHSSMWSPPVFHGGREEEKVARNGQSRTCCYGKDGGTRALGSEHRRHRAGEGDGKPYREGHTSKGRTSKPLSSCAYFRTELTAAPLRIGGPSTRGNAIRPPYALQGPTSASEQRNAGGTNGLFVYDTERVGRDVGGNPEFFPAPLSLAEVPIG
jgi:hypothetical protein